MKLVNRFFVSSTFKEFRQERDKLLRTIFPEIQQKFRSQGLEFFPIDLRWGVTEEMAQAGRTMEICFTEVERACKSEPPPDFLLMIGSGYGSRPLPSVITKEDFEKFKVYPEICEAYELDANTIWTLLERDCEGTYRLKEDINPFREENDPIRNALDCAVLENLSAADDEFRPVFYAGSATHQEFQLAKRYGAKMLVYFKDGNDFPEDITKNLTNVGIGMKQFRQAIEKYKTLSKNVVIVKDLESIQENIIAMLSKIDGARPEPLRSSFAIFLEKTEKTFCQREKEIHRLVDFARNGQRVLAVTGASGTGKSALLAMAWAQIKKSPGSTVVRRFIGIDPDCSSEFDLLQALLFELKIEVPQNKDDYSKALVEGLRITPNNVVLMIDALNQLSGNVDLDWLQKIPSNVRAIVSMIDSRDKYAEEYQVPSVENPMEIFEKHLEPFGRKLTTPQRNTLEPLLTGKNCLLLTLIAAQLSNLRSFEKIQDVPQDLESAFDHLHKRLKLRHFPELVDTILQLLLIPKHGITEQEIKTILDKSPQIKAKLTGHQHHKTEENDPIPDILWASIHRDLEVYLSYRNRHDVELIFFSHPKMVDYFEKAMHSSGNASVVYQETAGLLADHFNKSLKHYINTTEDSPGAHVIEEIVTVCHKASRQDFVKYYLISLEYIQKRCSIEKNEVYRLLEDYNVILNSSSDQYIGLREEVSAFWKYLVTRSGVMASFAWREGFVLQDAFNVAPKGHVHQAARKLVEKTQAPMMLIKQVVPDADQVLDECVGVLEGHAAAVTTVRISECGRRVISGCGDENTIRIWDIATGECIRTLIKHAGGVGSLNVSPTGKWVVSHGMDDSAVFIWDCENGECIQGLDGNDEEVVLVSITPDGKQVFSVGIEHQNSLEEYNLRVWDVHSGKCIRVLNMGNCDARAVAITPDGKRMVTGNFDCIMVWNIEKGECIRKVLGQVLDNNSLSITPDGKKIVLAYISKIVIWDIESGECIRTISCDSDSGFFESVSMTPDGRRVACNVGRTIRIWDVESGKCLRVLNGHTGTIKSINITPDGKRVVSGSEDHSLRVWDIEIENSSPDFERDIGRNYFESITPDGKILVSGDSNKKTSRIWDIETGLCLRVLENCWSAGAILPDGHRVVSLCSDGLLRVFDVVTGESLLVLQGCAKRINSLIITPNGKRMISVGVDVVHPRVWDLGSGEHLLDIFSGLTEFISVSITTDGTKMVSVGLVDECLWQWDIASGELQHILKGHSADVCSVSMTADCLHVISGSYDNTLRVWDLENGNCLRILEGHRGAIRCLAISPDCSRIISGSDDCTVRLWDFESGKCLRVMEGHTTGIKGMSITPDGRILATGSDDSTLRIWDLESGRCLLVVRIDGLSNFHICWQTKSVACFLYSGELFFGTLTNIL